MKMKWPELFLSHVLLSLGLWQTPWGKQLEIMNSFIFSCSCY